MKKTIKLITKLLIISISCFLVACGENTDSEDSKSPPLNLNKGATIYSNSTGVFINNLEDGIYKVIDEKREIIEYNKNNTLVYEKDGRGVVEYKGKEIILQEINIINQNISPDGKYLMYFTNNESLQLKILNLETEKYEDPKIDALISGELAAWYQDSSIVFYGIDSSKNNGIFSYDINSKTQKLIYKLEEGYIDYIEAFNGEVIVSEKNFNNEAFIKKIKGDEVITLSSQIEHLMDVEVTNKGIYILGQMKNDNISIYEYKDDDFQRVVFNFPTYISIENKLSSTEKGEILFIGSNSSPKELSVYKYLDGSISTISLSKGKYKFIKIT